MKGLAYLDSKATSRPQTSLWSRNSYRETRPLVPLPIYLSHGKVGIYLAGQPPIYQCTYILSPRVFVSSRVIRKNINKQYEKGGKTPGACIVRPSVRPSVRFPVSPTGRKEKALFHLQLHFHFHLSPFPVCPVPT
jgi:hypothetical protein